MNEACFSVNVRGFRRWIIGFLVVDLQGAMGEMRRALPFAERIDAEIDDVFSGAGFQVGGKEIAGAVVAAEVVWIAGMAVPAGRMPAEAAGRIDRLFIHAFEA